MPAAPNPLRRRRCPRARFPRLVAAALLAAVLAPAGAHAHLAIVRQGLDSAGSLEAHDRFGSSLATGDFNGDGFEDLAVGAPHEELSVNSVPLSDAGSVVVSLGSAFGLTHVGARFLSAASAGGTIAGGAQFGHALASGDFNGDGFADLAVGAPFETVAGAAGAGRVYVFYGSATGLGGASTTISQDGGPGVPEANDNFGSPLAAGSFNGDPFDELAVGSPGEDGGAGAAFHFAGSATGLHESSGGWFKQADLGGTNVAGDRFGAALATGNVLGTPYDELVVGAPWRDLPIHADVGVVYVIPGSLAGLTSTGAVHYDAGATAAGAAGFSHFGAALAVGKFSADAWLALAVGEPDRTINGVIGAGRVALARGGFAALDFAGFGTAALSQNGFGAGLGAGLGAGDAFGTTLAAGDWDADGDDDLAVGAPEEGGAVADTGEVIVFIAGVSGLTMAFPAIYGQTALNDTALAGDQLGGSLAFGKFDNSGRANLAIGVPGQDDDEDSYRWTVLEPDAGAVFIAAPWRQPATSGGGRVRINARNAVVYDCAENLVFSQRPFDPVIISSTTKIMTVLIACERIQLPANDPLHVDSSAVYQVPAWVADNANVPGSSASLFEGQCVTLIDLMRMAMRVSGNDAAYAIADVISYGGAALPLQICDFVGLMNARRVAPDLHMTGTAFSNPAGFDDTLHVESVRLNDCGAHHSTAVEMARLARVAMQNELFRQIAGETTKWLMVRVCGQEDVGWVFQNEWLLGLQAQYAAATGVKPGTTTWGSRVLAADVAEGRVIADLYGIRNGGPTGAEVRKECAALLRLGAKACGALPPPDPPEVEAPLMLVPGVSTVAGASAGGTASFDDFDGDSLAVDVARGGGPGQAALRLECERGSEVNLGPGASASVSLTPFESHQGFELINYGASPASVRVTLSHPAQVLTLALPAAGGRASLPGFTGPRVSQFSMTVQNLSTAAEAQLNVIELGYQFEVSVGPAPAKFSALLKRSGPIAPFDLHVRTAGHDAVTGNTVSIVVGRPGYVVVGVEPEPPVSIAGGVALLPSQPNPFRARTRIGFDLGHRASVELTVHDLQGRRIRTLDRAERAPGRWRVDWDGTDEQGGRVESGVYFVRLSLDGKAAGRWQVVRVK